MDHLYFTIQATEKYSAAVLHNKAPLSTFEATSGPPLAQLAETKPSLPRYHFDPTEITNIGFSATYIEKNVLIENYFFIKFTVTTEIKFEFKNYSFILNKYLQKM